MDTNTVTFQKRFLDKLMPLRFKVNHWMLQRFGLYGFALITFLWGIGFTLILNYLNLIQLN
jgi:hypothetical protein